MSKELQGALRSCVDLPGGRGWRWGDTDAQVMESGIKGNKQTVLRSGHGHWRVLLKSPA